METLNVEDYILAITDIEPSAPNTHRVVRGGKYLGCNFNMQTGVNVPHFGPLGFSYSYSRTEAESLAAMFGGEVEVVKPFVLKSRR